MHRTAPALALATTLAGLALAAAGCSSDTTPSSSGSPSEAASSSAPASSAPASPSSSAATPSPVTSYVDRIPESLRRSMFTQGAVPPSYADWISLSPGQSYVDGRREVQIDRRLPACDKESATHLESDQHAAGFAATLFKAGDYIVARQLTVYHDAAEAAAAMKDFANHTESCSRYGGKPVGNSTYGDLVADPNLGVPGHDQTVAGETALYVGGPTGAAWWTVLTRDNNAVVLTRVVDPRAQVGSDATSKDSAAFTQAVKEQVATSAKALTAFARS